MAIVAITAIVSLVTDYATKAVVCQVVCVQYRELSEEWRQLWYGEPSQADVNALREKYNRISNNYYDFPSDDALEEWRQLWYGEPSQADVNALREKYNRISNNYYDFPSDDALNEKAKDEAYKTLPSEFTLDSEQIVLE